VPYVISASDVILKDSSVTSPHPIASVQGSSQPVLPDTLGQSNEEIIAGMMSSERCDNSDLYDLFLEEKQPLALDEVPPRIQKATKLFFPKPLSLVAGQRSCLPRAAKASAILVSDELQRKKIRKVLDKQRP
jgi:hypothetical protein